MTMGLLCVVLLVKIFIWHASLVDVRVLRMLARTFEFWLLHSVNVVAFSAACCVQVLTNAKAAEFNGLLPAVELTSDITWSAAGLIGCFFSLILDALLVSRGAKLALLILWLANMLRFLYWIVYVIDARSYVASSASSLVWCVGSTCVELQVVRVQMAFTLALFCLKYIVSLLRFPNALVMLRSSIFVDTTERAL